MDIETIKQGKTTKELLEFGIINIDKPSGPTSFSVSEFICKKLKLRKTSHFGTLDPKVTGVLPIALNRACKLTGYFLGEDKEYVGVMRLHQDLDIEIIKKTIQDKFLGKITQMPPVKSRVKRQNREREIYSFELLEKKDKDLLFRVKCEGGTYIRKLIDDLGKEIEVGAHMLELRRISAGIFNEEDKKYPSIKMYDFENAVKEYENGDDNLLRRIIIPGEVVEKVYPALGIRDENLKQILTGKSLHKKDLIKDEGWRVDSIVSCFCKGKFIGMYKIFRGKEIFARPEFVMQEMGG
ncbi:MAG: RNA-guided pseudouridylation complex pseudouridine synthase subunit Cbf5 [Candidatus Pacearchaeota archaeon]|nr:RNA-guided pseudouridylation complex pseudouridine synthase subunit Cbf5 [Candidatus Pacearchaeota archaeon]